MSGDIKMNLSTSNNQNKPQYLTLKLFLAENIAFTNGGMRALLAKRHSNGLVEFGAVKVLGTKLLIDPTAFYRWIDSQNNVGV